MAKKPYIIALEEHYQDPEVRELGAGPGAGRDIVERLDDLGALRIREMDEAGIDLQVLSRSMPKLGRPWRAAPMIGYTRRCSAIPIVSPPSPCCRPPTRGQQPTSWSVQ